ncbi:MAG TPA: hypothetical protein VG318_09850 [Actinomycetota bacterium]|nr:hypothetical protein [Actinomycetota bacterium]
MPNPREARWAAVPRASGARWWLPLDGPRETASSFQLYQPVTFKGLAAWGVARSLARRGAFAAAPRGRPPEAVLRHLEELLSVGDHVAVARTNHEDRYVALVLGAGGAPRLLVKVATAPEGQERLALEAENVERFAPLLEPPLSAPTIRSLRAGAVAYDVVPWTPRKLPWMLPEDVARSLGSLFAKTAHDGLGAAHGDCAPWNLMRHPGGWTLVDWEDADAARAPFYDVFHFVVQSHTLLRLPRRRDVVRGLGGDGWIGRAIAAYAAAAGVPAGASSACFRTYLETSAHFAEGERRRERTSARARARLSAAVEGRGA